MGDSHPPKQARFRELLDRSLPRWAGVARAYATRADREDLLQEIALQVWRSLDRFRGESEIDTWAYRVALNTALGWRRKAASRRGKLAEADVDVEVLASESGTNADGAPEGSPGGADPQRVLDEFLASLSESDRAVMLLFLEDLPQAEAAAVLGVSPGAFRVRLSRVRKRFEERYAPSTRPNVAPDAAPDAEGPPPGPTDPHPQRNGGER